MSNLKEILLSASSVSKSRVLCGELAKNEVFKLKGKVFAVVDENVAALHPDYLNRLKESFDVEIIPHGEGSKCFDNVTRLVDALAERRFTRSDTLLAVGGGVTTDLCGFVASVYLRGINYVSVPTTLLAMVDAAIGGKCGVNLTFGKNLAGAFYQPSLVCVDLTFLDTLPTSEISNGIAEIIKYGVIYDKNIFRLLENFKENLAEIIFRCIEIKCEIVESDEHESGRRMLLNFGHTVGHSIEKLGGYEKYSHGKAVANGMVYESKFLELDGIVKPEDTAYIQSFVEKFGLKIEDKFTSQELFEAIKIDKKRRGNVLNIAGFEEIGKGKIFSYSIEDAEKIFNRIIG